MELPLTPWQAVLGKFLAAWLFVGVALLLTFPVWLTVNYLGDPDNPVILLSYIGSFLMAGAYLAVGACVMVCGSAPNNSSWSWSTIFIAISSWIAKTSSRVAS